MEQRTATFQYKPLVIQPDFKQCLCFILIKIENIKNSYNISRLILEKYEEEIKLIKII